LAMHPTSTKCAYCKDGCTTRPSLRTDTSPL
jgi:hypothetical protein